MSKFICNSCVRIHNPIKFFSYIGRRLSEDGLLRPRTDTVGVRVEYNSDLGGAPVILGQSYQPLIPWIVKRLKYKDEAEFRNMWVPEELGRVHPSPFGYGLKPLYLDIPELTSFVSIVQPREGS